MTTNVQTARQAEILRLAKEAESLARDARQQTTRAVEAALECGRLLAQEKAEFKRSKKQGSVSWDEFYAARFGQHLPAATANRYLGLQSRLAELPPPDSGTGLHPNLTRLGLAALDVFPRKTYPQVEGSIPIQSKAGHLILVLKFNSWKRRLDAENKGQLSASQRAQLKKDFAPIMSFLRSLG